MKHCHDDGGDLFVGVGIFYYIIIILLQQQRTTMMRNKYK